MEERDITVYGLTLVDGPDVTEDNNYIWFSSRTDRERNALEFLTAGCKVRFEEPHAAKAWG